MLPITIPPMIPEIRPEIKGAPQASAIPRHKGSATRKTTIPAGMSLPGWLKIDHPLVSIFALVINFLKGFFLFKIVAWVYTPLKK